MTEHFVKAQLKAKTESIGVDAKAGQTLATCHDAVVLIFGPMVRYLRRVIMNELPSHIFVNCGRSLQDQSQWARTNWKDKASTTSDYTGYDSTQRGDSLGFENHLNQHWNIPHAFTDLLRQFCSDENTTLDQLYVWWKLNIVSDVIGSKRTGRDTGEPGTYDFNTYFNLALIGLMYDPPPDLPIAVGGDDMAANAVLTLTKIWLKHKHKFEIIAKVEHTDRPEFCGYYLTSRGCYKNPRILMLKLLWHEAAHDAEATHLSYAAEAQTCYVLADHLYEYCSFEDLECLGWVLDYFHTQAPAIARHFFSAHRPEKRSAISDWILEDLGLSRKFRAMARSNALINSVGGLTGFYFQ